MTQPLPDTRASITHKFSVNGCEGYLTVGLDDAGHPRELFVKIAKEGSTLSGLLNGFCRALSLALQRDLPLAEAVERFRDMRFEPMGPTRNPAIPEARSLLDYIARYLELQFTGDAESGIMEAHGQTQNIEADGGSQESPAQEVGEADEAQGGQ